MAYVFPHPRHDDLPRQWTRLNEPPPPIASVARNRGLTPLQTYLRLLEEDRIDLNSEVNELRAKPWT
jgi:hypothetical protein